VCKGSADPAGSPVSSGDTVCGYRLGATQVAASCDGPQIPAGTRAWQEAKNESNATEYDMQVDPEGCDLDTPLGTTIWLQTAQPTGPDVVVLSDFVPHTDWGAIGVELACNDATCVNFYIDPAGVYRLDEMRAYGQWSTVARGALPPFTISHLNRLNRMVVRYRDRSVQAFLDGYQVVRATTSLLHAAGYVSVYSNDVVGTEPALVHVRTFDVFAST
jgi:hypothetical protein